jgi:hypothetical protein
MVMPCPQVAVASDFKLPFIQTVAGVPSMNMSRIRQQGAIGEDGRRTLGAELPISGVMVIPIMFQEDMPPYIQVPLEMPDGLPAQRFPNPNTDGTLIGRPTDLLPECFQLPQCSLTFGGWAVDPEQQESQIAIYFLLTFSLSPEQHMQLKMGHQYKNVQLQNFLFSLYFHPPGKYNPAFLMEMRTHPSGTYFRMYKSIWAAVRGFINQINPRVLEAGIGRQVTALQKAIWKTPIRVLTPDTPTAATAPPEAEVAEAADTAPQSPTRSDAASIRSWASDAEEDDEASGQAAIMRLRTQAAREARDCHTREAAKLYMQIAELEETMATVLVSADDAAGTAAATARQ